MPRYIEAQGSLFRGGASLVAEIERQESKTHFDRHFDSLLHPIPSDMLYPRKI